MFALKNIQKRRIKRVLSKEYIQIHSPLSPVTGFFMEKHGYHSESITLNHYNGILAKVPFSKKLLTKVSEFNHEKVLLKQQVWKNTIKISDISYEYSTKNGKESLYPISKTIKNIDGTISGKCALFFHTWTYLN